MPTAGQAERSAVKDEVLELQGECIQSEVMEAEAYHRWYNYELAEMHAVDEFGKGKRRVDALNEHIYELQEQVKQACKEKDIEMEDLDFYRGFIKANFKHAPIDAPEEPEDARPVVAVTNEARVVHKEISIAKYDKLCKSDRRMSMGYAGEEGLYDEDEED